MPTSIRLPHDIERRLNFLARQTGRTKAFYIRQMILERIDDVEHFYLAADAAERARKGEKGTFPAQEVRRKLRNDD